jgi:hypothetical protein
MFGTYNVFMQKSVVLNYSMDFDDIALIYSPTTFYNGIATNFNWLISSPGGQLTSYSIRLTYPGGTSLASGVNAIGEQLLTVVNVTGADAWDLVTLEYNYTSTISGVRTFLVTLPIITNGTGSGTWMSLKDKTYGLGLFERILIVTIIVIFTVGIATMVGQPVPGIAVGVFVFCFLAYMGFVPVTAVLPSIVIGIIFLMWKSGG